MVDESLTREEFVKSFENVVNFVKDAAAKLQSRNDQEIELMKETIQALAGKLSVDIAANRDKAESDIAATFQKELDSFNKQFNALRATVTTTLASVKNGKDGLDGAPGKDADAKAIQKAITAEVRQWFDELAAETDTKIKAIPERPTTTIFGPGKTRIVRVDLSSQLNGVTKTFFLGTHFGIVDVSGSSAPFGAFRETVDYQESGKNIVFTSNVDASVSLPSGQSLIVKVLR